MQNQLYAEHEMIFFKEGILGGNLFKKIYLLLHLKSELILPMEIKNIDINIRNLKSSIEEDPFIIAAKIDELNRKKEFILHYNLLLLKACNLEIKKLKNTLRWKIYNFFNFFQDQTIFGDNAILSFSDPFDCNRSLSDLKTVYYVNITRREHERRILGGFMSHHIPIETCSELDFNDFDGKDHQIIFQSMSELIEENKPLDPLTVSEKLDNKNSLNKVGGRDYLIELANKDYPYSVPQINMDLRFIKSISRCCELRQEVRDFIIYLRENENQVFIRSIEEWLSKNIGNVEIPIVRYVIF